LTVTATMPREYAIDCYRGVVRSSPASPPGIATRCVGSGVIDFPALFAELISVGFAGLLEIELEEQDRATAAARTGQYLTTWASGLMWQAG